MVFNDSTNKNGIIQDIEFWTALGRGTISGDTTNLMPEFTMRINSWYHKVVSMILAAQDSSDFDDGNQSDYPIITTNLVAGQADYSIPLSEKVIKIKRAEASFDGTNWERLRPVDINEISTATDTTTIGNDFETSNPYYDFQYNSVFLYPIPDTNVTNGLKLWVTREIMEYSGDASPATGEVGNSAEPGFNEAFHRMLSIGPSLDWILVKQPNNRNLINSMKEELAAYELRIKEYYGRKHEDGVMHFRAQQSAADYS